jgi:hypothetical protein
LAFASEQKMEGVGGRKFFAREPKRSPPPARLEQKPAKKFSFPFRRKNRVRAK